MVDLHCHILPGIDDGAQTIEDSLAMAEDAIQDGITCVVATPHASTEYHSITKRCGRRGMNCKAGWTDA